MKNKLISKPSLLLLNILLNSCSTSYNYNEILDDYVYKRDFHDKYNILQLTDIHWNVNTSTLSSKTYLEKLLKEVDFHIKETYGSNAKIDLIEITGDLFMLANTYHVNTFISFFEEQASIYNFEYAIIWGNHDRHGLYNPDYLSNKFKEASKCLYIEPEDNLYGRSNFIINLNDSDKTIWQIVNLDSGASFSETALSTSRDYDYIRDDQVSWYLLEHEKVGKNVPSIAYYHIPQDDNKLAWDEVSSGASYKNKFFKLEGFADNGKEEYASKFIKEGRKNNLKAAFMGHAHNIDWTVDYNGVVLGLGVKTGKELYFAHIDSSSEDENMIKGLKSVGLDENFDLIGASLVTLNSDESFELEHLYFNERESGDFKKWIKW